MFIKCVSYTMFSNNEKTLSSMTPRTVQGNCYFFFHFIMVQNFAVCHNQFLSDWYGCGGPFHVPFTEISTKESIRCHHYILFLFLAAVRHLEYIWGNRLTARLYHFFKLNYCMRNCQIEGHTYSKNLIQISCEKVDVIEFCHFSHLPWHYVQITVKISLREVSI